MTKSRNQSSRMINKYRTSAQIIKGSNFYLICRESQGSLKISWRLRLKHRFLSKGRYILRGIINLTHRVYLKF